VPFEAVYAGHHSPTQADAERYQAMPETFGADIRPNFGVCIGASVPLLLDQPVNTTAACRVHVRV